MSSSIVQDSFDDIMAKYDPSKNETRNILSKYEKAKLLGLRQEQLARGAEAMVDTRKYTNIVDIAQRELQERTMPLMIMRVLPGGVKEYWKLEDMVV